MTQEGPKEVIMSKDEGNGAHDIPSRYRAYTREERRGGRRAFGARRLRRELAEELAPDDGDDIDDEDRRLVGFSTKCIQPR